MNKLTNQQQPMTKEPSAQSVRHQQAQTSDEELLLRAGQQNERAFRALYERFKRCAFGLDHAILQDVSEAQDAVQEKFIKIWRYASAFTPRGPGSARRYIMEIDRNICREILHKRRVRQQTISLMSDIDADWEYVADYLQSTWQQDPGAVRPQQEDTHLAEKLLSFAQNHFKPIQYLVFVGFLSGMSCAELAATHNITKDSARGYVARSFKSLREIFAEGDDE